MEDVLAQRAELQITKVQVVALIATQKEKIEREIATLNELRNQLEMLEFQDDQLDLIIAQLVTMT